LYRKVDTALSEIVYVPVEVGVNEYQPSGAPGDAQDGVPAFAALFE